MKRKSFVWFLAGVALLLVVSGCASSDAEAADDPAPEQVVRAFYDWYLAYPGNALVDGAHRASPYLSPDLVRKVDEVRASFTVGGYDPILCAQDVPNSLEVGEAHVSGDQATVRVTSSFPGHELNVRLARVDGAWKIDDTGCLVIQSAPPAPSPSPTAPPAQPTPFPPTPTPEPAAMTAEGVVAAFYEWYIGYLNQGRAAGEMHNPLTDGAYRSTDYLTQALVAEIEARLASSEPFYADPFLCAQDVPTSFTIPQASIAPNETLVTVETSFAGHAFQVEVVQVDGEYKIDGVVCPSRAGAAPPPAPKGEPEAEPSPAKEGAGEAQVEGWQVLRDESRGFQIRYPLDWTSVEVELRHPELDKPLVRLVQLLPQAWADEMSSGGPPDPSQPPVVAPLSIEVSLGEMEAYRRLYVEPTHVQTLELGGQSVVLEEYDSGGVKEIRYLYQHPVQSELRVTVRDQLGGFPTRVEGNESVIETANLILTTFEFVE